MQQDCYRYETQFNKSCNSKLNNLGTLMTVLLLHLDYTCSKIPGLYFDYLKYLENNKKAKFCLLSLVQTGDIMTYQHKEKISFFFMFLCLCHFVMLIKLKHNLFDINFHFIILRDIALTSLCC